MVQDQIGHHRSPFSECGEIGPFTKAWLQFAVAGHRKAAITAGLEEGQHVHHSIESAEVGVENTLECLQAAFALPLQGVGVSDQNGGAGVPARLLCFLLCADLQRLQQLQRQFLDEL